jgi:hypothetical protein
MLSAVVLALAMWAPAWAASHSNLEEGLPARVEDAYAVPYGDRQVQGLLRYDEARDHKALVTLEPRVEYGLAPGAQVRLASPLILGTGDKTGSGDVILDGLYNFNMESRVVPAMALSTRLDLPTGRSSRSTMTTVMFIATKTPWKDSANRFHLNLAWENNPDPGPLGRKNGYLGLIGYSRPVGASSVFVADFFRERQVRDRFTANVVEIGFRYMITPLFVISTGGGADIVDRESVIRGLVGFEYSF